MSCQVCDVWCLVSGFCHTPWWSHWKQQGRQHRGRLLVEAVTTDTDHLRLYFYGLLRAAAVMCEQQRLNQWFACHCWFTETAAARQKKRCTWRQHAQTAKTETTSAPEPRPSCCSGVSPRRLLAFSFLLPACAVTLINSFRTTEWGPHSSQLC